jgi:hypothetical protein
LHTPLAIRDRGAEEYRKAGVSGVLFVHRRPVAVYSVFTKLCCWQEWLCAGAREQNAYFFDCNLCENALQLFEERWGQLSNEVAAGSI